MHRAAAIILGVLAASASGCGSRSLASPRDAAAGSAGETRRTDAAPFADAAPLADAAALTDAAPLTDGTRNPATLPDGRCIQGAYPRDGACSCQPSVPSSCGERCTNLELDDDNCGACGHACGSTSTCNQGVCTPAPIEILAAQPGCVSLDLASNAGALFWAAAGHGTIARLRPGEAVPTVMASGETGPAMIAARGDAAFWVAGDKKLLRVARPGAAPVTVTASATDIHGLALTDDGATVYFSTDARIMRVAASGGDAVEVARDKSIPMALALEGDRIAYVAGESYWVGVVTLVDGQPAICDSPPNYVNCAFVGRGMPMPLLEKILWADGRVVWANADGLHSRGTILQEPGRAIGSVVEGSILGFAVTAGFAYYSGAPQASPGPGEIHKGPLAGDWADIRLARNQNRPRALVVDDARVYWSTGDCRIMATGL